MAPRRSRKAGKMGAGAERRRQRRLEDEAMLDLMDTCDLTEDEFLPRLETSRERRVIDLNLAKCSMRALPDSIGGLKALRSLDLAECVNLTTLPESIAGLTALERLELPNCGALTALPAAIGELKSLTELDLTRCESLTELPATIGGLTALEQLVLTGCSITALPDAIVYLKSLWKLDLGRCESLTSLPHALDELKDLTELNLAGCSSLTALPPAIETMPNLDIKGWEPPLAGCERFADLARPRVKALYPERADEDIDGMISRYYWSSACERAKIDEAMHLEIESAHDTMPRGVLGLNAGMFDEYMKFIANRRCSQIGLAELYPGAENPFPWMSEMMDLNKEKNFFETRVIEYQSGGALSWD